MRRHDIRFPLRGRVWAAVPFFLCLPLRREWAAVPVFLCPYLRMGAIRRAEHGLPTAGGTSGLRGAELCGLHGTEPPVCAGRNVRPEWNGTSGLRGGRNVRSAGAACTARRRAMRRRCRGRKAECPGPLTEAPGGGPGRDLSFGVPAGRGKDSGKRAASAAVRCRQRTGSGGRRIPASEEKQKAVFVRKPLLSYDRIRYSLSGVTLT